MVTVVLLYKRLTVISVESNLPPEEKEALEKKLLGLPQDFAHKELLREKYKPATEASPNADGPANLFVDDPDGVAHLSALYYKY